MPRSLTMPETFFPSLLQCSIFCRRLCDLLVSPCSMEEEPGPLSPENSSSYPPDPVLVHRAVLPQTYHAGFSFSPFLLSALEHPGGRQKEKKDDLVLVPGMSNGKAAADWQDGHPSWEMGKWGGRSTARIPMLLRPLRRKVSNNS